MRLVSERTCADDILGAISVNIRRTTVARRDKLVKERIRQTRRILWLLKSGRIYTFEVVAVKSIYYR